MQPVMKQASSKAQSVFVSMSKRVRESVGATMMNVKGTVLQAMAKRMDTESRQELIQHWSAVLPKMEKEVAVHTEMLLPHKQKVPKTPTPALFSSLDQSKTASINLFHPVLGESLADLGYKQLYLTNVRSLALAPVWKKQRILRPDRAKLIATDKIRNGLASSVSGTISLFMDKTSGEIGIIDGQHRAGSLMILSQMGHWDPLERNILVEVFPVDSAKQVSALFREINAAEPVRMVDLLPHEDGASDSVSDCETGDIAHTGTPSPSSFTEGAASTADSLPVTDCVAVLSVAAEVLMGRFPAMFKPSSRCKPPHLNVDVLRDDLFQSGFLLRHPVAARSPEALLQLLDKVNADLGSRAKAVPEEARSAAEKKAAAHSLFLGLDKAWLYAQH